MIKVPITEQKINISKKSLKRATPAIIGLAVVGVLEAVIREANKQNVTILTESLGQGFRYLRNHLTQ